MSYVHPTHPRSPTIPARRTWWTRCWFDAWSRLALRRQFYRLQRFGDPDWINRFNGKTPRLYVANHVSFWDGIVLHHLIRRHLPQPAYCMIDLRQMRRHRFFRRIGGFSIDRDNPRDALAGIEYAVQLLDQPTAVVLFPQGQIRPVEQRPLAFEPAGLERLVRRAPAATQVIPVALRYDFWAEQRGEALLHLSPPIPAGELARLPRGGVARALESAVTVGLDELTGRSARREAGDVLLWGRRSISEWGCGK